MIGHPKNILPTNENLSLPKNICKYPSNFKVRKLLSPQPLVSNMSTTQTPSKKEKVLATFIECSWAFSASGSLYVRLSPLVAEALGFKRSVHFKKLGKVEKVTFTSKVHYDEVKHAHVFKLEVNTLQEDESQDVDVSYHETYALKEEKFSDFSVDASCTKLFKGTWKKHSALLKAHSKAMKDKQTGKKGDWLKKCFKTDVLATQNPYDSPQQPDVEEVQPQTATAPASFSFDKEKGSTPRTPPRTASKRAVEESSDEGGIIEVELSQDVLGPQSQRIESTHFGCVHFFLSFLSLC